MSSSDAAEILRQQVKNSQHSIMTFEKKKAERFFKERGIKYQFIDMKEKGMSKGEFPGALVRCGWFAMQSCIDLS